MILKDLENLFKISSHSLPQSSFYGTYGPDRAKRRVYLLWKRFFDWSDMTLTIVQKTSIKITAHPLTKGTLWVKFELDRAKRGGGGITLNKWSQTDRRTDGLITIGNLQSGVLVNLDIFLTIALSQKVIWSFNLCY